MEDNTETPEDRSLREGVRRLNKSVDLLDHRAHHRNEDSQRQDVRDFLDDNEIREIENRNQSRLGNFNNNNNNNNNNAIKSSPVAFRPRARSDASRVSRLSRNSRNSLYSSNSLENIEDDVCFPVEKKRKAPSTVALDQETFIHYDEMEEFIQQELDGRAYNYNNNNNEEKDRRKRKFSTAEDTINKSKLPSATPAGLMMMNGEDDEKAFEKVLTDETDELAYAKQAKEPEDHSIDRFSYYNNTLEETVHVGNFSDLLDDEFSQGAGQTLQELFNSTGGPWWLDCLCPTEDEVRMLAKAFSIHPLTSEDIRCQEAREKVELFNHYYFVSFRAFEPDEDSEDYLEPIHYYIIVFSFGLLSFHFSPVSHSANVRRRVRQLRDYYPVTADWISYALIDDIVDSFAPLIHRLEMETDAIEDSVLILRVDDSNIMLRRIASCRQKVMALHRLLGGKADVIKMFAKRCNEHWHVAPKSEIGLYLGDIQDHILTMHSNLTTFEKILSRSHANYLAQLHVDSMRANNHINEVLGKITIIGTVLLPMNLITGLWGMNVHIPGQGGESYYWFFGIVASIFLLMGSFISVARWRKYI